MPEVQSPRAFLKQSNLSHLQLAMLELTNGSKTMAQDDGPITLTSKSAYLWAGIIEATVRSSPGLSWNDFRGALQDSVIEISKGLIEQYDGETAIGPADMSFFHGLLERLDVNANLSAIEESVRDAYSKLVEQGFIADPFRSQLKKGIAVAVLSFVPVSFTSTTDKGQVVSREFHSLVMNYQETQSKDHRDRHFEFKLLKFLQAFQKGVVEVFSDATSSTTSQPNEKKGSIHGKKRTSRR
jgi:hypothetical protein